MIPENLTLLHGGEEELRKKALETVAGDTQMQLHLGIIEAAMGAADAFRQFETDDEDLRVVQVLAMRTFNAFASSLKLSFSGYFQNSALILRDALETAFLLDFFNTDRTQIQNWRKADEKTRWEKFKPGAIRIALDKRDGNTEGKRGALYKLFSELAGHPTMKSAYMMRPEPSGDAFIGPFMETTALQATLGELGKLAVQIGESICAFLPNCWEQSSAICKNFNQTKGKWVINFYGASVLTMSSEGTAKKARPRPSPG